VIKIPFTATVTRILCRKYLFLLLVYLALFLFTKHIKGRAAAYSFRFGDRSQHDGLVFNPLTVVANGAVGKGLYTLTVRHAIQPFTLVAASIFPRASAKATVPAISPGASVPTAVAKQIGTMTLANSVTEFAFVKSTVWPGKLAVSVAFVFPKDTVVGAAIAPAVDTTTVTLIKSVLAFVSIAVGKRSSSESVPSEIEKKMQRKSNACVSNESNPKFRILSNCKPNSLGQS
jgi:hypothetical protein